MMATLRFNRAARSNSVSLAGEASNSSAATTSGAVGMKFVQKYLDGCRSFYSCIYCRTHLANHDELISRSFQGNRSRAYLFNTVINVSCGPSVQRELNTGAHSVADIFCANCGTTIGWKYERAFVDSQKYKEGKFIIELAHVVRENRHLELDKRDIFLGLAPPGMDPQNRLNSTAKTIGTGHQGSLSPASSTGQWSPGTSSSSSSTTTNTTSSSSSSSSPSSSLSPPSTSHRHHHQRDDAHSKQNCRYSDYLTQASTSGHAPANFMAYRHKESYDDDNLQDDDIDDDEVLMFPFYDDLYGNRSSYSNLSASRSYQRNMQRRSMYLEASPSNRRPVATNSNGPGGSRSGGRGDAAAASSSVSSSATNSRTTTSGQPLLFSRSSRSIEIPLNQTTIQAQADNNNADSSSYSSGFRQQKLAASNRFSAASSSSGSPPAHRETVPPPQSTSQASNNSLATVAAAQAANRNSSEHVLNSGTSAARNDRAQFSDRHVDEDDTQFQFEHDNKQLEAGDNDERALPVSVANSEICSRNSQNQISLESASKASGSGSGSSLPGVSGHSGKTIATDRQEQQQHDCCDDSGSPSACRSQAPSNSLSFDDEEFYDCNTDHDFSNSSPFKPK